MNWKEDIDYSLVICTYNPDERILTRCLRAVQQLNREQLRTEVILVDNNSSVPLAGLPYVQTFIKTIPDMQLILVREQGVNHARIAAIEAARGQYIVYFDYDNEPESDYLQELKILNRQYPQVAAWGPGQVKVDFIDGIEKNIEHFARMAFQHRQEQQVTFAAEHTWQPCYPFGTGLCTKAFLLKEYVQLAREGSFTLSGRKGNKLSSGEDTQMVLLCVSKGYAAGVAPALKLTHIIPASRANSTYLKRLIYGTFVCYETCRLQVFPGQRNGLESRVVPGARLFRKALKKLLKAKWTADPHRMFDLVEYLASNAGVYTALNKPIPASVSRIIRYLEVE